MLHLWKEKRNKCGVVQKLANKLNVEIKFAIIVTNHFMYLDIQEL